MIPRLFSEVPSKVQLFAFTAVTGIVLLGAGIWTQARLGDRLLPHAICISASQPLLLLHLVSDGLIAFAYLLIPWAMWKVVRERDDMPFSWVAWVFGAFIVACGITHAMQMWTLWYPVYWYSGVAKAFTAVVSLGTAWLLYVVTPQLLAFPSARQLRESHASLEREVAARQLAEVELKSAKAELEVLLGRSTAQAQRTAAVLDRFFEVAPMGLGLLDESERLTRVNPALPRLVGVAANLHVHAPPASVENMPREFVAALDEVAATRHARTNVEAARRVAGEGNQVLLGSFFPIELDDTPPMYGIIVQDISYQRQIERQRSEALSAAEQANHAKDEFLAKVSHELRSPLQVALSSAEVLKRFADLPPQAGKFVERLAHAVSAQARMINDLLDISRILSGKMHIEMELLDPTLPLSRAVEHSRTVARSRGLEIDVEGALLGKVLLEADPTRLEQVFTNLLDNAIRFSEEPGRILVRVSTDESGWLVAVRDFGIGLTAEEMKLVFRPFAQGVHQPRSGKGMGLGLSIVSSLVEAFGGRVWVESAGPRLGSTFFVQIPLAKPMHANPAFSEEGVTARLDAVRVLYVEDDAAVAQAMGEGLAHLGAKVEVATNYTGAIALLEAMDFDVVVSDLNLGEGPGGHDVARAAQYLARHRGLGLIAVSAFGRPEDVAESRRAGFASHLVKPATVTSVAQAISALVRPPSPQAPVSQ